MITGVKGLFGIVAKLLVRIYMHTFNYTTSDTMNMQGVITYTASNNYEQYRIESSVDNTLSVITGVAGADHN